MGDGGFWHNGLATSVGNAVFNKQDGVILVVDNFYSAATGGQDILSSRADNPRRLTKNSIVAAVRGIGATWVRQIDQHLRASPANARHAERGPDLRPRKGPKIIVASSECMLNKQRRLRPLISKAIKDGKRVVRERFGVDEDVCTGDHACMRLSGCPVAVGQGNRRSAARRSRWRPSTRAASAAATAARSRRRPCSVPSFYRADIISNPNGWDRYDGDGCAASGDRLVAAAARGRAGGACSGAGPLRLPFSRENGRRWPCEARSDEGNLKVVVPLIRLPAPSHAFAGEGEYR